MSKKKWCSINLTMNLLSVFMFANTIATFAYVTKDQFMPIHHLGHGHLPWWMGLLSSTSLSWCCRVQNFFDPIPLHWTWVLVWGLFCTMNWFELGLRLSLRLIQFLYQTSKVPLCWFLILWCVLQFRPHGSMYWQTNLNWS